MIDNYDNLDSLNTYVGYFSFETADNESGSFEIYAKSTGIFEIQRVFKKKLQQFCRTSNIIPEGSIVYLLDVIELTTNDVTILSVVKTNHNNDTTTQIAIPERLGNTTSWSFSEPDDPQVFFKV